MDEKQIMAIIANKDDDLKYKKNMPEIARAHGIRYVATATISDPRDLKRKVKKAMEIEGASYIHVLTPCNLGWGFPSEKAVEMARLTVDAGLFPVYEYIDGELVSSKKIKKIPVEQALFGQKRFKHLKDPKYVDVLKEIQDIANKNIEKYNL